MTRLHVAIRRRNATGTEYTVLPRNGFGREIVIDLGAPFDLLVSGDGDTLRLSPEQLSSMADLRRIVRDLDGTALNKPLLSNLAAYGLGCFLHRLIETEIEDAGGIDAVTELFVETDDPVVAGLVWPLLRSAGSVSLGASGVPCAIVPPRKRGTVLPDAGLPVFGNIDVVVVAPNPSNTLIDTQGAAHFDEVVQAAKAIGAPGTDGAQITVTVHPFVRTWSAMKDLLLKVRPHVLYYYGHGIVTDDGIFQLGMEDEAVPRKEAPLPALVLRDWLVGEGAPVCNNLALAILNCCYSGHSATLGGASVLGPVFPALVCNRFPVLVQHARPHGLELLRATVGRGMAPHEAVRDIVAKGFGTVYSGDATVTTYEPWWLAPLAVCNYARWAPRRPERESGSIGAWQTLSLDRSDQSQLLDDTLNAATSTVLVGWTGSHDDDVASLNLRLLDDMLDKQEREHGFAVRLVEPRDVTLPKTLFNLGHKPDDDVQRRRLVYDQLAGALGVATAAGPTEFASGRQASDPLAIALSRLAPPGGGTLVLKHAPLDAALLPKDDEAAAKQLLSLAFAYDDVVQNRLEPTFNAPSGARIRLVILLPFEHKDRKAVCQQILSNLEFKMKTQLVHLGELKAPDEYDILRVLKKYAPKTIDIRSVARQIHTDSDGKFKLCREKLEGDLRYY